MELIDLLENCPKDNIIGNNLIKAYHIINNPKYEKIMCSISGGSDSDIMLDICIKCDKDKKIDYVWFDTGLEYKATKEHLRYLEEKYNIAIKREKAIKPIPLCCKEYGQPFISKQVSQFLEGLQRHNFKWEDKPFEDLINEYPKCKSYLQWWCNTKQRGNDKRFCIAQNKWLKEYIISNPPNFKISAKCCKYAKKDLSIKLIKKEKYDLSIVGVRKAEGGQRATAYKNCFDQNIGSVDNYRPIFYYLNDTKTKYATKYGVQHSDCYTKYGMKRTGCAGCPHNRELEEDLKTIKQHEPNLYLAANNIFKDSYEYTRKYRKFVKQQTKINNNQGDIKHEDN